MHAEIGEAIQNYNRTIIAAPRGHGKSTIAHLLAVLYYSLEEIKSQGVLIVDDLEDDENVSSELQRNKLANYYRRTLVGMLQGEDVEWKPGTPSFIMSISATSDLAEYWLDQIKDELTTNELILRDYPMLRSRRSTRYVSSRLGWERESQREIKLPNGVRIKARGVYAAKRGQHFSKLIQIGNYISSHCLLKKIVENDLGQEFQQEKIDLSSWERRLYRALDMQGNPTCPALWPLEKLEAKRREMGEAAFAAEYLNSPESSDVHKFKRSWIAYYTDLEIPRAPNNELIARSELFMTYDAAAGTSKTHDYRAWGLWARVRQPHNEWEKQLFLLEWGMNRHHPQVCAAEIVAVLTKYLYRPYFVERKKEGVAQLWLKEEIRRQMKTLDPPRLPTFLTIDFLHDKFALWEHTCAFCAGTKLCIPIERAHVITESCVAFPDVEYDDICDMISTACRYCQTVKVKNYGYRQTRLLSYYDEVEEEPVISYVGVQR